MESFDEMCANIDMVSINILNPSQNYKQIFSDFIAFLDSFYSEFGLDRINEFIGCYNIIKGTLEKYVKYYPNFSKGYAKKFNKTFLYGLSGIVFQLIKLFNFENVSQVKINDEVIRRFILDKEVGFGRKYHFNSLRGGFVDVLNSLTSQELLIVFRLLERPSYERKHGWMVLGSGRMIVRILIHERRFKKYVYYLFRTKKGKEKYNNLIFEARPPESFPFEEFVY